MILMLLVGLSLTVQILRQRHAAILVNESDRRISRVEHLMKLLVDMETGFRGYLLSGDGVFLEPYSHASGSIESELNELRDFDPDDPRRAGETDSIRQAVQSWQQYARFQIERRRNGTLAVRPYADREGKQKMDAVRDRVQSALTGEEEFRNERNRNWDRQLLLTLSLLALLLLLASTLLVFFWRRQLTRVVQLYESNLESTRRSEEKYRALFDGIRDYGVALLSEDGEIESWNSGAERVTGYAATEAIGRKLDFFYPDDDTGRQQARHELSQATQEGRYESEGWRRRKNDSRFWAESVQTALHHANGSIRGYSVVFRDYSKRRHLEEERAFLIRKLEEGLQARDEFLAMASHELRTPLTSIWLQLQTLERIGAKERESFEIPRRTFETFERQCTRMIHLINGMLDLTRIHLGQYPLKFKESDLSKIVERAAADFHDRMQLAGCSLKTRIEPGLVGSFDEVRLEQVFVNLLDNALKYGCNGPIRLELARREDHAVFTLQDQGPGIPKQYQEKIFERYGRVEGTHTLGGLGLGLYFSQEIIHGHGGTIRVESESGKGALFVVELPIAKG